MALVGTTPPHVHDYSYITIHSLSTTTLMDGYQADFLSGINLRLPGLTAAQKRLRAPLISDSKEFELRYTHFSIVMNKSRKFAFFVATNIDGFKWNAEVKDRITFAKDRNILDEHQIGDELYDFYKSVSNNDFDKGHIAKFQDPQWGDLTTVKKAADETMKYSNCVPQHHTLNRGAWKSLEDYIVKKFTKDNGADGRKVSVFAGPVLLKSDPYYIDLIDGKPLQIPCHFYKVVVYRNKKDKLSAVAFIMSQENILREHNFVVDEKQDVRGVKVTRETADVDFFEDFKTGEPYQVRIDFVEQVTGLKFSLNKVVQPYTKKESTKIIYKRVEVPVSREAFIKIPLKDRPLNFEFERIKL
jgi:endonuclease G